MAIHKRGEQCIGVVSQQEPGSPPPGQRVGHRNKKVRINLRRGSEYGVHIAQGLHSRVRALSQPRLEKVAPQVEVGLNPNVGLAQGHEGLQ
jgi:hypothetical protein